MKHLSAPPQPLRKLVPSLLPALERVVLRALAKDPQERFACVQDFAAALEQASFLDESSIGSFSALQTDQPLPLQTAANPLDESLSTLPSSLSDDQLPPWRKS
jgi:serine/threonine protein kinase